MYNSYSIYLALILLILIPFGINNNQGVNPADKSSTRLKDYYKHVKAKSDSRNANPTIPVSPPTVVDSGSFIIDMGIVPQTEENGLKPYGLIFDLIKNFDVPALWVIEPNKVSDKNTFYDDVDFVYDGNTYKGGPFIIEQKYRFPLIDSVINAWVARGVVGVTTTSDITVPVFVELDGVPNWTLDFANGSNLIPGFDAAEIPEFNDIAETDPNFIFKPPDSLDCGCDYMYAMPHADPEWSTHGNLATWILDRDVGGCRGWFYSACHAVSAVENSWDDVTPDSTQQMNFLSEKIADADPSMSPWAENSLVIWGDHDDGDGDYVYDISTSAHPFMQFMGQADGAFESGSEQVYLPYLATQWRPTTTVSVYDDNHPDIGGIANSRAAKLAYGPAYGVGSYTDYTDGNGWVMYHGGHQIGGSEDEFVALYRSFFNFSFLSSFSRGATISYTSSPPPVVEQGSTINLSASASGAVPDYTFEWAANPPIGIFTNNPATVGDGVTTTATYQAPQFNEDITIILTLSVTDGCGIVNKENFEVVLVPPEQPPLCQNHIKRIAPNSTYVLDLKTIATDVNDNLPPSGFSIITQPLNGTVVLDVDAVASYTPDFNFIGSDSYEYMALDDAGNSCTGTVTLIVDCPQDEDNNQIWGTVFHDENEDGLLNVPDQPYKDNPTIYLYRDDAPNDGIPDGPPVQSDVADNNGVFEFTLNDNYFETHETTYTQQNQADDAREKQNGDTEDDKTKLVITGDGDDIWNGIRFTNVDLPPSAIINSAHIVFRSSNDKSGANASVRFLAHDDTDDPPQFLDCSGCFDITSRPLTENYVDWVNLGPWIKDSLYYSPDLKTIVQEIVYDQAGINNGSIAFLMQSLGLLYSDREAYSFKGNTPSERPKLIINYTALIDGQTYSYIVEIDQATVDPQYLYTTPTTYQVMFDALGTSDCHNDFGLYELCETIYTNGFLKYNRRN